MTEGELMTDIIEQLQQAHRILQHKEPCTELIKGYLCRVTEKPSGRIHPCPVEHGEECYMKGEQEDGR